MLGSCAHRGGARSDLSTACAPGDQGNFRVTLWVHLAEVHPLCCFSGTVLSALVTVTPWHLSPRTDPHPPAFPPPEPGTGRGSHVACTHSARRALHSPRFTEEETEVQL